MEGKNWSKIFSIIFVITMLILAVILTEYFGLSYSRIGTSRTTGFDMMFLLGSGIFLGVPLLVSIYLNSLKGKIILKLDRNTKYLIGDEITGNFNLKIKKEIKNGYVLIRLSGSGNGKIDNSGEIIFKDRKGYTEVFKSEQIIESQRDYLKGEDKYYNFNVKIPNFDRRSEVGKMLFAKTHNNLVDVNQIDWKVTIEFWSNTQLFKDSKKIKIKAY